MSNEVASGAQAPSHSFANIPEEMKGYKQFVNWKLEQDEGDKKTTKVLYNPHYNGHAAVDNSGTWVTFEEAVAAYERQPGYWAGIGFVLTPEDPFCFIDLDNTRHMPNHEELFERQQAVFAMFESYAELSPSNTGVHIITKGNVERGRKRAFIEVYSQLRFMTMTGNVMRDAPIVDEGVKVKALWHAMGKSGSTSGDAPTYRPQTEDDDRVLNRMFTATNGEKVHAIYDGNYEQYVSSPSEADLALFNYIVFYTKNKEQIIRMFQNSALGKRKKAHRVDYLERTIALAFDRDLPPVSFAMPTLTGETGLPIVWAKDLANVAPIPPEWLVVAMIIARNVTLFYGDGGTGKSLLALMLAYCVAADLPWLGIAVRAGPALFFTAEDENDEVHRRLFVISRGQVALDAMPYPLAIVSLADGDALLAEVDPHSRKLRETALYEAVRAHVETHKPALVVLDTVADLFDGNENDRREVRWFITALRRIAIRYDTTIVLLAHPSRDGIKTGRGDGGSTAWNNSVRSRLSLTRIDGSPNKRALEVKKANYGQIGEIVDLEFRDGKFVAIGKHSNDDAHKSASQVAIDALFLELLAELTARGQKLSASVHSGTRYAPKMFAVHSKANGTTVDGFKAAMNRLMSNGRVAEVDQREDGRVVKTIGLVS